MDKPQPRVFVKTIDGQQQVQAAHTPADAVRLAFSGWREMTQPAVAPSAPAPKKTAAKTAATSSGKTATKATKAEPEPQPEAAEPSK